MTLISIVGLVGRLMFGSLVITIYTYSVPVMAELVSICSEVSRNYGSLISVCMCMLTKSTKFCSIVTCIDCSLHFSTTFALCLCPPSSRLQSQAPEKLVSRMKALGTDSNEETNLQETQIVQPHLNPSFTAQPDSVLISPPKSSRVIVGDPSDSKRQSSLKLQGGDIHRDLYKIDAKARLPKRSLTFSHPSSSATDSVVLPGKTDIRAPGAFRRQFLLQQRRFNSVTTPITNNFVSFLDLYDSFYGEDLQESDEEDTEDQDNDDDDVESSRTQRGETRPLPGRRKSSRAPKKGDANLLQTFFLLLKSFIGTGVLFLPKAFRNGGLLFSSITLVAVSLVTCVAFHLLLQCRAKHGGGYGEISEAIGGKRMRTIVLASITFSQIGFVCAGVIFIAENLYSFFAAVIHGSAPLSVKALIGIQLLLLIPLSMIRNISKLGSSALLADVFMLLGLSYIYHYDVAFLIKSGLNDTVRQFNSRDFTLTVGSAIFSFEGIGLILPIQSSMKAPQHFSKLLYGVMFLITVVFTSIGALSYATFGDSTNVEIISNFPRTKFVNAVQFL